MQIDTNKLQRPKLFDSFFDKELDYKNDYVVYIDVTSTHNNTKTKQNTNLLHSPQSHNNALSLM